MEEAAWGVPRERAGRVSMDPSRPTRWYYNDIFYSYTYELCFFDEAKQKPKSHGSNVSLGLVHILGNPCPILLTTMHRRFDSWNPSPQVKSGEPEYYKLQIYKGGTRCWNGPERNVVVRICNCCRGGGCRPDSLDRFC